MKPYNFGAGPSHIPDVVLDDVQSEIKNWQGLGCSLLEVGHRTPAFTQLMEDLSADFRTLLQLPPHYHVLFIGGPARAQFAMLPMNLLDDKTLGAYMVSGLWSSLAYEEALKLKQAYCIAQADEPFHAAPILKPENLKPNTAYLYYTPNETIQGVRYDYQPDPGTIPLIADMTSCLLSEPVDINRYGLVFAGAQKNIGAVGLTAVIIREDLIQPTPQASLPTLMDYRVHIDNQSLYATPPMFSCYLASKMLKWMLAEGGVQVLYERNLEKARLLYDCIDSLPLYQCDIPTSVRSRTNVCFQLTNPELTTSFLADAETQGLVALKGHRYMGGVRASLYNAMPLEGVHALTAFMRDFSDRYA